MRQRGRAQRAARLFEARLDKVYVHAASFYEDHGIELLTSTTVERIAPGSSEVVLGGGERLRYDRLLVSTGARPHRLSKWPPDLQPRVPQDPAAAT